MSKDHFSCLLTEKHLVASTDEPALASALDREADLALSFGGAAHAEYLARRAADLRESVQ